MEGAQADWWRASRAWAALREGCAAGGAQGWRKYRIDLLDTRAARAAAFAAGRSAAARALFEASPEGELYVAEQARDAARLVAAMAALEAHVGALDEYLAHWGMRCGWTTRSFELMARAVGTLLQARRWPLVPRPTSLLTPSPPPASPS